MNVMAMLLLTLIVLVVPFIIYLTTTERKGKVPYVLAGVVYLILASPVVISVVNDYIMQYEDANIGLGLSFMFTWLVTGIAFLVSLYFVVRKKWVKKISV